MAFASDVEQALVDLATAALYPDGVTSAGQVSSTTGYLVHLSRGWPLPDELDRALANNVVLVTVYQEKGHSRLADGYLEHGYVVPGPAVTLTVEVSGSTVTLGGFPTAGQLVGVLADGIPTAYKIVAGDTLESVAAALSDLLNANAGFLVTSGFNEQLTDDNAAPLATTDFAIANTGPPVTITIASNRPVIARSVGNGTAVREYRWQEEVFRVITWAPSADARDAVENAINLALAQVPFLVSLPNSPAARLLLNSTERTDVAMKADLFRGDLCFNVTYCTTSAQNIAAMLWGDMEIEKKTWGGTPIVIRKVIT